MEYYIIVYKNTYDAMSSEKILKQNNMDFNIMPTPTSITQSCGICSKFTNEDDVKKIINENIVDYKNIYKRTEKGYEVIK